MKKRLYQQLIELLIKKVDTELNIGDVLPSERELSNMYGISRATVRLALDELEYQGYIIRKQGQGTFVRQSKIHRLKQAQRRQQNGTFVMKNGVSTIDILHQVETIETNKEQSKLFAVPLGTPLMSYVKTSNEKVPVLLERGFLLKELDLSLANIIANKSMSVYQQLQESLYNDLNRLEEEYFASSVKPEDALLLQLPFKTPVLAIKRIFYNTNNSVVGYMTIVAKEEMKYHKTVGYL